MLAGAGLGVHLDEIADFEGAKHEKHDAGGEVPERTLERKTDGEACRGKDGGGLAGSG